MQPGGSVSSSDDFIFGFGNEVIVSFVVSLFIMVLMSWLLQRVRVPACVIRRFLELLSTIENMRRHVIANSYRWMRQGQPASSQSNSSMVVSRTSGTSEESSSVCCVCLMSQRLPTMSNCGHLFCAECIMRCWEHQGTIMRPLKCPLCRRVITLLMPSWSADTDESSSELYQQIAMFNRRFSGEPRTWLELISEIPVVIPYMFRQLFSVGNLMWMFRLRIVVCVVAAIVYALSPFDIFPEAVFGILGILDDVFVVILLFLYMTIAYRRFMAFHQQR